MTYAIETDRLSKSFGEIDAVIDLDLRVRTGEMSAPHRSALACSQLP